MRGARQTPRGPCGRLPRERGRNRSRRLPGSSPVHGGGGGEGDGGGRSALALARLFALLALPLIASPLAGCGFTPVYAEHGLAPALSGVAVVTPEHSRFGYLLREQLDDALGRDRDRPPAYRLETKLTDYRSPLGVRVNNVANRYEVGLTVAWTLVDAGTGKTVTQGSALGRVSYDSADAPYGGVAAEQDGEARAADQAATAIRLALSRWFKLHPPPAA